MKKFTENPLSILPVLALVVIASLLLVFESDFLWKLQETNLFLGSRIFLEEQLLEPGGFLTLVSTWFTQFLYYPWVGVLLLCGWWLLLMWLVRKAFCINARWQPLTIVPVLFLLVTIVDMGYWVYILKLRGHVFLGTIGTTAAVALLWAFRSLVARVQFRPTLMRSGFVVLAGAVGYPLLGVYGIAATALMAVWIWRLEPRRSSALAVSLTGFLSAWLLPLFFYRFVYYQTNLANVYAARLPLYYVTESYNSYYVPFLLLLLFFLVMVVLSSTLNAPVSTSNAQASATNTKRRPSPNAKSSTFTVQRLVPLIPLLLLFAASFYTYMSWYTDENFHRELSMQRSINQLDWEGVLKEAAKQDSEPTRAIVMMRNLALARLGRQADEMYHYKNGCNRCDAPFDIRAINSVGSLIYYHYGMPNYSYRLCMERGVEFGWRVEQLKYMARCSILNGEMQLARKYLRLLKQTLFHDTWADELWQLTEHPENIPQSQEMGFITHMMHYSNQLTTDHNLLEDFLMKRIMYSNYFRDPIFLEQALLASLAAKNPNLFWPHLYNYAQVHPNDSWPLHIQEAAYLFGTLEGRPNMDRCPVDPSVRTSFDRFNQTAPLYEGQDIKQVQQALYPLFGNTYYYDYYLVNFPSQN